uniref:Uncharacterized protein AlNc14C369G11086 n=1 Tax=Albugo laibachii Nc14 TaxID=890382 RepID=F0WY39_9STRA|nr:conserved hypothetical protein [Albugo laibachii Nc14]|eukprot:CCA26389.1 conserved hypothetical protein [Albugo laibachii Nc14]
MVYQMSCLFLRIPFLFYFVHNTFAFNQHSDFTFTPCTAQNCLSGRCEYTRCDNTLTCDGGHCSFNDCEQAHCNGGACVYRQTKLGSCNGGKCDFDHIPNVDDYCEGGACTSNGHSIPSRISHTLCA